MFTKLLKHEWRAIRGVIGLLCVIILISGLTIGGVANYMARASEADARTMVSEAGTLVSVEETGSHTAEVICVLLVMVSVIAVAVCCAGSVFYVIWRFYESRFTDQGYLTFTLPVNNHQILLSSILSSIFGVLLVIVAAAVAVLLSFTLFLLAFPVNVIWADLAVSVENFLAELWASCVKNWNILASVGISGILAGLSQLIMFMLSVTVGAILAKKWKLLAAVAVYYGISILRSFICGIGLIFTAETSKNMMQVFSLYNVVALVTIVGGYFLMYSLMEKKLNLA